MAISRKTLQFLIILFTLLVIPLTLVLALSRQEIRKKAAEITTPISQLKPEYAPGEILVKLKTPINNPDLDKKPLMLENLGIESLPPILKSLNDKYKIKSIEKVFKGAENPQKEMAKLKQKFSEDISAGKRQINEEKLSKIDLSKTYKLSLDAKTPVDYITQELSGNSEIEYVEPNYIFRTQLIPNDPFYLDRYPDNIINRDPKWNPSYDYQWNLKKVNFEQAWDITTGSSDITVAVVDTGVDYSHPEVGSCTIEQVNNNLCPKISPGYDVTNNDSDPIDDNGHGTHVAGLITAYTNNPQGIASPSWQGKIMPVKVLDSSGGGTTATVSQGVIFASRNGARIINMSLGNRDPFTPIPRTYKDALDYAYSLNVVLIAAAGNSMQLHPGCRTGYWPADYRFVIEVAASKEDDRPASYSNCSKDIAAPGGESSNILSLASSLINWNPQYLVGTSYTRKSGTSMAAPLVSGLSLLILSIHPDFTNEEVRSVLKQGADSMWNIIYGAGRINASRTLSISSPAIAFISKPSEENTVGRNIDIQAILRNVILPENYLSIADGWHSDSHDGSFSPRNDGVILTHPEDANFQGTIATWDTSSYSEGKYTIWLHTESTADDFLHVTLIKDILHGWPTSMTGEGITIGLHHPLVSDLTGEGRKKIIFGSSDGYVHIFNDDGTYLNGWPKYIGGQYHGGITSNPAVADFDRDGQKEIVVNNSFLEAYSTPGGGFNSLPVSKLQVLKANGATYSSSWPKYLVRQGRVANKYPPLVMIDDVDNDGQLEIIADDGEDKIHVLRINGEELPGWPIQLQYKPSRVKGAVGNVIGDKKKEIIIAENDWFPEHRQSSAIIHVFGVDGREIQNWPKTFDLIDGGGRTIESPPTLVDLDNNGFLDILTTSGNYFFSTTQAHGEILAWKGSGENINGWPVTLLCGNNNPYIGQGNPAWAQPTVGHFLPGGKMGIAIETSTWKVCLYNFNGAFQRKFDLQNDSGGNYINFPFGVSLADLNRDGNQEIVTGSIFQKLYAFDVNGNNIENFPKQISTGATPFIADINGDNLLEIGTIGNQGSWLNPNYPQKNIFVWETNIPSNTLVDWPMWGINERHTSVWKRPNNPPTITTSFLPPGKINLAYTANIEAIDEDKNIEEISVNNFPSDLQLNKPCSIVIDKTKIVCQISGKPVSSGISQLEIIATDEENKVSKKMLEIVVLKNIEGLVKKLSSIISSSATHELLDAKGNRIALLKGKNVDLSKVENTNAILWGIDTMEKEAKTVFQVYEAQIKPTATSFIAEKNSIKLNSSVTKDGNIIISFSAYPPPAFSPQGHLVRFLSQPANNPIPPWNYWGPEHCNGSNMIPTAQTAAQGKWLYCGTALNNVNFQFAAPGDKKIWAIYRNDFQGKAVGYWGGTANTWSSPIFTTASYAP